VLAEGAQPEVARAFVEVSEHGVGHETGGA
jgi:hypothetical protein